MLPDTGIDENLSSPLPARDRSGLLAPIHRFFVERAALAWTMVSAALSLFLLIHSKSPTGDLLSSGSDHLHHARITWSFLHLGPEVYTRPFTQTGEEIPYPQPGITWGDYPMAYPPGMLVLFLPVTLIGAYVKLSPLEFGKIGVGYLTLVTHVALFRFGKTMRRLGTQAALFATVMVWIFAVHAALRGFFDGAWFLAAILAVDALAQRRNGASILWLVVAALLSYRAACLIPIGLLALAGLLRAELALGEKLRTLALATAGAGLSAVTFVTLVRHSPHMNDAVASPLVPLNLRSYEFLLVGGIVTAVAAQWSGLIVGGAVLLSTVLTILHAGHNWHGYVCITPLLVFGFAPKKPSWMMWMLIVWLAIFWQFAFGYAPLVWLEELIRFFDMGGHY